MQNVNEAPTFIHQFDQDEQIVSPKIMGMSFMVEYSKAKPSACNLRKKRLLP